MTLRVFHYTVLATLTLASCTHEKPASKTTKPASTTPHYRLFFLSDVKGELEPCGCTLEPLGGLARLASYLKERTEPGVTPVLLTHGDLRAHGSISKGAQPQLEASARFLQTQLISLGLKASGDGPGDRQLGDLYKSLVSQPNLPHLKGGEVRVVDGLKIMRGSSETTPNPTAQGPAVMLFDGDLEAARKAAPKLAKAGIQLLLLNQGASSSSLVQLGHGVFAVQGGERGQHVVEINWVWRGQGSSKHHQGEAGRTTELAALQQRLDGLIAQRDRAKVRQKPKALIDARHAQVEQVKAQRQRLLKAPLPKLPESGNFLTISRIPLDSKVEENKRMSDKVQNHHRAISALNKKLESTRECPPQAGADQALYIGSQSCQGCHPQAYDLWKKTPHAHAWDTLVQRGRTYDYNCVSCHSSGFDLPEGFCRVSEAGDRINVGCESCHGPGSTHAQTGAKSAIQRDVSEAQCQTCHHPPHTNTFVYADRIKRILGPGHGAP